MKVDPKTGMRYAHTPEEWAEVIRKHGAGMSLPASVAARIYPALNETGRVDRADVREGGSPREPPRSRY